MLRILVALFIIIGLLMLICGLLLKPQEIITRFGKRKTENRASALGMLESITSTKLVHKPLAFLSQDKEFWTNKLAARILELSEVGISLEQMYLLKIICLILCTVLLLVIRYTNINYQTKQIVEVSGGETPLLFQDEAYNKSRYQLYQQVAAGVGRNKLNNVSDTDKNHLVEEEMAECLNTSDKQLINDNTQWFLKTWREVQSVRVFKYQHFLIIGLALFVPEFLLTLRWLLRGCVYKKEIIKLEYIFGLLARVEGIKTLDIIYELEKSSKIYSKYLHEFAGIFKYDKKRGFDYLKNRNIKSLYKMAKVLEIYTLSDRMIALQVLEREVMERDESIIITADETIDFIDLVAFLSIAPLVYELARLMLNPMLEVVYKAFEFI